jgi:hypothetical protein
MTALDALLALFAPVVLLFLVGWVATLTIVSLWCLKEQVQPSQSFFEGGGRTQSRLFGPTFR